MGFKSGRDHAKGERGRFGPEASIRRLLTPSGSNGTVGRTSLRLEDFAVFVETAMVAYSMRRLRLMTLGTFCQGSGLYLPVGSARVSP